jgi:benzoyl-CoA reductase subunit C
MAQGLRGKYNYLDGLLHAICCLHTHIVFDAWRRNIPIYFNHLLTLPTNLQNPHAKKYIIGELEDYQQSIEEWLGKTISLEKLDEAIDVYNTNRRLMTSIYHLMKADDPPVTEEEVSELAISGLLIDKKTHNSILEEALKELPKRKNVGNQGPRLMLLGSENTNLEFIRFIDSLGGRVVIDDYCTGSRYYDTEVIPEENRLGALATRIINRAPCPMKDLPVRRRPAHITKLVDEYKVQGVIFTPNVKCDPHGLESPMIEKTLKEKDIPMLRLEMDLAIPVGQFRTRIEAFLEILSTAAENKVLEQEKAK